MLYHGVVLTGQSVKINEMVVGIVCVLGSCLAFIPKWLVNICYCWGMNTVTTNLMLVYDTPTYSLSWFWYIYMVYLGVFFTIANVLSVSFCQLQKWKFFNYALIWIFAGGYDTVSIHYILRWMPWIDLFSVALHSSAFVGIWHAAQINFDQLIAVLEQAAVREPLLSVVHQQHTVCPFSSLNGRLRVLPASCFKQMS